MGAEDVWFTQALEQLTKKKPEKIEIEIERNVSPSPKSAVQIRL